jgi:hypothetical protein
VRSLNALTLDRLLAAEAFVLVAGIALLVPTQNDTWWQLAAGRDMVATHRVALVESWSHTARGAHWPNYEWLTEVVFYALYRAGGLPLLTLTSSAVIVVAYALSWRAAWGPLEARALMLIGFCVNSTLVWAIRPQIYTLCLVAVVLRLVLARRWIWLPPLFVLWANLHGGVALGGLLVVAALIAAWLTDRRLVGTIVLTGMACLAAGCLTPLGLAYWLEIVTSIGRSASNAIAEWRPPQVEGAHLIFWATFLCLPVLAIVRRQRLRTFDTALPVLAALLCGVLATRAQRNVPVFLLLALPAITRLQWDAPPQVEPATVPIEPWRLRLHQGVLAATMLAATGVLAFVWSSRPETLGWRPMSSEAADAISSCQPPIYNPYNEGGYIVWFAPEQPVFLDSRQDPYPVSLVQAHIRAEQQLDYMPLFRQYGIKCAVFPTVSDGPGRLVSLGWHER